MRTIYIAGYGRSGSTVLGTLLGFHRAATHVGELSFLFEDLVLEGRTCSCGSTYRNCEIWSEILDCGSVARWSNEARLTRAVERISGLPALLAGIESDRGEIYGRLYRKLFARVREVTNSETIVDSSKSAWGTIGRLLALERYAGEQVFVLHLVRSGRATMQSLLGTGSNWALEGRGGRQRAPAATRAAVGWTGVNYLTGRLAARMPRGRYLCVRYEDLTADPVRVLGSIGQFAGVDLSAVIERVEEGGEFDTGHVVGGNRLRFDRTIRLARSPNEQAAPPPGKGDANVVFRVLGGWLEHRYGYGCSGPHDSEALMYSSTFK